MSGIDYAGGVPPDYRCVVCGDHGVKLWRQYQTFVDRIALQCVSCAVQYQRQDDGRCVPLRAESVRADGRWLSALGLVDTIGCLVPAVPDGEGSFWGYTSVPDEAIEWWRRLPIGIVDVDLGKLSPGSWFMYGETRHRVLRHVNEFRTEVFPENDIVAASYPSFRKVKPCGPPDEPTLDAQHRARYGHSFGNESDGTPCSGASSGRLPVDKLRARWKEHLEAARKDGKHSRAMFATMGLDFLEFHELYTALVDNEGPEGCVAGATILPPGWCVNCDKMRET